MEGECQTEGRRAPGADERRLEVLRAIVEDFVSTNEPVGSRAIAENHALGVSPATVRNDMAVLEEEGYITQPHTSAGRIPTDRGYRLFVDRLSSVKPLSPAERRALHTFLAGAVDLDDVVRRSVRLLAQFTRQVAIVQYPTLSRSRVRHIEVVPLASERLLLVLITDTGRVEQRTVEIRTSLSDEEVADLRSLLNAALERILLVDAPTALSELTDRAPGGLRDTLLAVTSVLLEALVDHPEERVVLAGTANLARNPVDFAHRLRPILEALEEQVVLLKLFGEAAEPGSVVVRIGEENPVQELRVTSVVAAGYGVPGAPLASLGVLGPTRMDYPATIAAVRAIARYVGNVLSAQPAGG